MTNVMVRKAVLDEIAEQAKEDVVVDYTGLHVEDLIGVTKQANRMMVREGEHSRPMTYNAVNLITTGLQNPQWLAGQFDERVPDFWAQYWEEDNEETHPNLTPQYSEEHSKEGEIDFGDLENNNRFRSREILDFWAEIICDIEKDDVADDHYQRYYRDVYLSLISGNHHKLKIGVIPWGDWGTGDAIVLHAVPKWIFREDPDKQDEQDHETNSAADAGW